MSLFFSPYTLTYQHNKSTREGALLQFCFKDGLTGYADCHPWVELGDKPLKEQLRLLAHGQVTQLTKRSRYFARIDGKARSKKLNLLEGLKIPESHWLSLNGKVDLGELVRSGFRRIKMKMGSDLESETSRLLYFLPLVPDSIKLRLDFNERLSKKEFENFLNLISPWIDKIDFIEDPFTYHNDNWFLLKKKYPVLLAKDHNLNKINDFDVIIIKPAKIKSNEFNTIDKRVIVTSYLDHPLGQMSAAYCAAKLTTEVCGLMSHYVYEASAFSEALRVQGSSLLPVSGTGFGFDDLLEKLPWKPCVL